MSKNIAVALLCLATLGALGWGFYEHRQARKIQIVQVQVDAERAQSAQKLVDLNAALDAQKRAAETKMAQYEATIGQLKKELAGNQIAPRERQNYEAQISELRDRLAPFAPQGGGLVDAAPGDDQTSGTSGRLAALLGGKGGSGSKGKGMMNEMSKMMKNPAMRKMVESQQASMMGMMYDSLFYALDLPEDQQGNLKDLLAKKQSDLMNLGFDLMDETLTADQKKEMQKSIQEKSTLYEQQIEALLGKDKYDVYKAYEETQAERMQVQMFNDTLGNDLKLSDAQENDLVWAMHKARSEFKFSSGLENQNEIPDFEKLTAQNIQTFSEENKRLNAQYIEIANKMLKPDQAQRFRENLEQMQALQELGMKMFTGE